MPIVNTQAHSGQQGWRAVATLTVRQDTLLQHCRHVPLSRRKQGSFYHGEDVKLLSIPGTLRFNVGTAASIYLSTQVIVISAHVTKCSEQQLYYEL